MGIILLYHTAVLKFKIIALSPVEHGLGFFSSRLLKAELVYEFVQNSFSRMQHYTSSKNGCFLVWFAPFFNHNYNYCQIATYLSNQS